MNLRTRMPALLASVLTVTGSITLGLGVTPASAAPAGTMNSYGIPFTASTWVTALASGPNGDMWFGGAGIGIGGQPETVFGKATTAGAFSAVYEYGSHGLATSAVYASDGNMWFGLDAGSVVRVTPAGVLTAFQIGSSEIGDIIVGPDNNLWMTEPQQNTIWKVALDGTATTYPLPGGSSIPYEIATGADGRLWFTAFGSNEIGALDPGSGTFTMFPGANNPSGIAAGTDGNVYFVDNGNITAVATDGTMTPCATGMQGTDVVLGADGNLWISNFDNDSISKYVNCGNITTTQLPT